MKKKILAASLATTIAGTPLIVAGPLVQTVAASSEDVIPQISDRLIELHGFMEESELTTVSNALDNLRGLNTDAKLTEIFNGVTLEPSVDYAKKRQVAEFIESLAQVYYSNDPATLEASLTNVKDQVKIIRDSFGISDLTAQEVYAFTVAMEDEIINSVTLVDFINLDDLHETMSEKTRLAMESLLDDQTEFSKVKTLLVKVFGPDYITDFVKVKQNLDGLVDPYSQAEKAIMQAVMRSEAKIMVDEKETNPIIVKKGSSKEFTIKILDVNVFALVQDLRFEVKNGDKVSEDLTITLANGTATVTPKSSAITNSNYQVKVYYNDTNLVTKFEVDVNPDGSGGGTSGGGGGGTPAKDNVGTNVSDTITNAIKDGTFNPGTVNDIVKNIKEQLKGGTAEDAKAALRAVAGLAKAATGQMQKDLGKVVSAIAAEYVKKAAQEQLTATKENGQAKATATAAQLKSVVEKAAKALEEAKAQLAYAGVKDAALRAYLTLNVPDAAKDTVVNLSISDLQSALSGLDNSSTDLRAETDGVSVSINVTDILQALTAKASVAAAAENSDYSIQILKSGAAEASAGLKNIAGVEAVELKVTSKDKEVTKFNSPVTVEIEVGDLPKGTDVEKVLAYKLVDGKWIPVGGTYEAGVFTFTTKQPGKYTVFVSTKTFADLGSVSWAQKQIEVMAAKGIVNGRSDSKFAPNANVTRAEFASLIVRALGLYDDKATAEFKDVKSTDWYSAAVGSAVKAGIVKGVSADQFKPNATITRQEMATMLANALKLNVVSDVNVEQTLASFTDSKNIQDWAKESVALTAQYKLVQGMPNGTFAPSDKATRAQAAVVMYNLTKLQ